MVSSALQNKLHYNYYYLVSTFCIACVVLVFFLQFLSFARFVWFSLTVSELRMICVVLFCFVWFLKFFMVCVVLFCSLIRKFLHDLFGFTFPLTISNAEEASMYVL